jgi:hypothetical protein
MASRVCHGKPLPCSETGKCVSSEEFRKTELIQGLANEAKSNHPDFYLHKVGGVLQQILRDLTRPEKMHFNSAHDSTLSVLAAYFNVKGFLWPSFASNMVIEIWNAKGVDMVRVFYHGQLVKFMPLKLLMKKMKEDVVKSKKC